MGRVTKTYFSSPTFTAGKFLVTNGTGKDISFSGKLFLQENDEVILEGKWTKHPKYGDQFDVNKFSYNENLDEEGLKNYIAKNPNIKGIGPVKAAAIAAAGNLEDNLKDIEAFAEKVKVKPEVLQLLKDEWEKRKQHASVLTKLSGLGFSNNAINKLLDLYGDSLLNILKTNPYVLINAVPGFGFKKTDELARRFNVPKDNPSRIAACLMYLLSENENEGHCWIDKEDLLSKSNRDLAMDCLNSKELIENHLKELLEKNTIIQYNQCIGFEKTFSAELFLAEKFKEASTTEVVTNIFNQKPFNNLNDKQREAFKLFLGSNQCLIGGIAGAGKSYLLYCIVEYCRQSDKKYVVACPTGKAAKRVEELISEECYTLHRLLGYQGKDWGKVSPVLLDADVVIVDEVSMVDVPLMHKLYSKLDFTRQKIVLAGDFQQLPPVGVGNILRDIIDKNLLPQVLLTECMRQAGELKENCNKLLKGTVAQTSKHFIGTTQRRPWYKVTCFTSPEDIQKYIRQIYRETLVEKYNYDLLKDVQVLTPTHKGELGTLELNKIIQEVVQNKVYNQSVSEGNRFYVGDKVINKKNKYDLGIMNGDIGVVKEVIGKNKLVIEFIDKKVTVEGEDIYDIYLAYALTIHSYQGSQIPCAIVICHKSHSYQHNRNLLYTAATRAQQSMVLIGDIWSMTNASKKTQVKDRRTFLNVIS